MLSMCLSTIYSIYLWGRFLQVAKVILGVDPGIRHGVKMAVIDDSQVAIDAEGKPATARRPIRLRQTING